MNIQRTSLPIIQLLKQQDVPIERLNPDNLTVEFEDRYARYIVRAIHKVILGDKEIIRQVDDNYTTYISVADTIWDKVKERLLDYRFYIYLRRKLKWKCLVVNYRKIPCSNVNFITEKHYHVCPYPFQDHNRVVEFLTSHPTVVTGEVDAYFHY
jgi:hypothetical protein